MIIHTLINTVFQQVIWCVLYLLPWPWWTHTLSQSGKSEWPCCVLSPLTLKWTCLQIAEKYNQILCLASTDHVKLAEYCFPVFFQMMKAQPPILPRVTTLLAGALVALGVQEHRPALNLLPPLLSSLRQSRDGEKGGSRGRSMCVPWKE